MVLLGCIGDGRRPLHVAIHQRVIRQPLPLISTEEVVNAGDFPPIPGRLLSFTHEHVALDGSLRDGRLVLGLAVRLAQLPPQVFGRSAVKPVLAAASVPGQRQRAVPVHPTAGQLGEQPPHPARGVEEDAVVVPLPLLVALVRLQEVEVSEVGVDDQDFLGLLLRRPRRRGRHRSVRRRRHLDEVGRVLLP